jgi:hypothetical protein
VAELFATVEGALTVCPSPALADPAAVVPVLDAILALPVELVLVAHGEPVLRDARQALEDAVARFVRP